MTALKILGIDTTAKTATAAVISDGRLIALTVLNTPNTHSVTLLPMIDGLLKSSSLTLDDVDLFACSVGPGSFTGVRIGTSAIKGLAYANGKPCVGVSSLEALALNVTADDGIICSVMDARRAQFYNALFKREGGALKRLTPDSLDSVSDVLATIKQNGETVYVTGDGEAKLKNAASELDVKEVHEVLRYQNAYNVALLAGMIYESADAEQRAEFTAEKLAPVYLRASQAERERLEKIEKENITTEKDGN